jgi:DnaJ-domain-containing protein 1
VRAEFAALEPRLAALLDGESAWETARARVRELKFLGKLDADIDDMLGELES